MPDEQTPYFTRRTEGYIERQENTIITTFQKPKIKLRDEIEIDLVKTVDPNLNKKITSKEDKIIIQTEIPKGYHLLPNIHNESTIARWQLSYNLLKLVENHSISRLHIVMCPCNILYGTGLIPHVIHYGVTESIPPYEKEKEILWLELKSVIAYIVDKTFEFDTYLDHFETIDLSEEASRIMYAENFAELSSFIQKKIEKESLQEKTLQKVPKRKWKINRFSLYSLIGLVIPAIIYIIFISFFKLPEQEAYVSSSQAFLQDKYSSVIDELDGYSPEKMPYVVKYQLAKAYVQNEALTEEQKQNIQNVISLQADERYFLYWIYVGRGEFAEAIDIAKRFEDRDLILFALYKERQAVQSDTNLKGEERDQKLKDIDVEIKEYESEIEAEEREEEQRSKEEEREREQLEDDLNEEIDNELEAVDNEREDNNEDNDEENNDKNDSSSKND
ncbi:MAG TPA: type VII secretion protein EssB [Bacillota bacterium]|nr:type VII secretion protein EssB [Bacillota bacterium]